MMWLCVHAGGPFIRLRREIEESIRLFVSLSSLICKDTSLERRWLLVLLRIIRRRACDDKVKCGNISC
jgi:hypothetical protein